MKTKNRIRFWPSVIMGVILILSYGCEKEESEEIKDADGNVYTTVTIGTQIWMKENLKTTKYNDGTSIPMVTDGNGWVFLATPGYCWFNNDEATYKNPYGALYNWMAVETGKLCPAGWHVPTETEWSTLITFLGGEAVAGGKLKETGTTHWKDPNTAATNESGFTALPGGERSSSYEGFFSNLGEYGIWWSSTKPVHQAWIIRLYFNFVSVERAGYYLTCGVSVRCIKD